MSRKPVPPPKQSAKKPPVEEDDDDDTDNEAEIPTLRQQFTSFARFNDSSNPATHIRLSESDNWMRQAGVIKGRQLTTTDTGVCFFKFKKSKLTYEEYLEFLELLADYKKIKVDEIIDKMLNCGAPAKDNKANVPLKV